jgi:hypothetical protein
MNKIELPFDVEKVFEKYIRHKTIPKNDLEKQAILIRLIREFEDQRIYSEQEVNEILKKHFDDYALLRREMINFGYMQRNPKRAEYWVAKRELTKEDIKNNT